MFSKGEAVMATKKQLEMIRNGVEGWNKWRKENSEVITDLSEADLKRTVLSGTNLIGTNLYGANLFQANLFEANLSRANLSDTNLSRANLSNTNLFIADLSGAKLIGADLSGANFKDANLVEADLSIANLKEADLSGANLKEADLTGANLKRANLNRANLNGANLNGANLTNVQMSKTVIGDNDLSQTIGLATIRHESPSTLGTNSLHMSKGKIPIEFMRGCGLSDWEIESAKLYAPNLTNEEITTIVYSIHDIRATQSIQISPLFISYSHSDTSFVDSLETKLNDTGIRSWRDVHDSLSGPLEEQVDRAIRHNPTVLLILSANSIKSDWVEHEVNLSRKLQKEIGHHILCPITLDDKWKTCDWPARLMEQVEKYNILDFSKWEIENEFNNMYSRLVQGLDLFYK